MSATECGRLHMSPVDSPVPAGQNASLGQQTSTPFFFPIDAKIYGTRGYFFNRQKRKLEIWPTCTARTVISQRGNIRGGGEQVRGGNKTQLGKNYGESNKSEG